MVDLSHRAHPLIENHALVRDLLATHGPAWLQRRREEAFLAFQAIGLPTTRDEEFRYLPLRALNDLALVPAYGATVDREQLSRTPLGTLDAVTVTFVNGEFAPELTSADTLPEGVFIGTLAQAFEAVPATVDRYLTKLASLEGRLGSTNDERFTHLNTAYLAEGAFVFVPRGVVLERPVHIQYVTKADHGPIALFPRTLIVLDEGAEARVVESYVGLAGPVLSVAVTEVSVGERAILHHVRYQEETPESFHISVNGLLQEGHSTLSHHNVNFGSRVARHDVNVWLDGERTETTLNGANIGTGEQMIDNHTRIDHAKPNCHSFETYKTILRDHATGVFNGKIFVYEDAQKTDAKQTNQALLLSPDATMNTKPQLEIFADDVKCTHGATIGQLREDALFYLRARGIPKAEAQSLLVFAFAAEVIEQIPVQEVREALERRLFEKLTP